MAYPTVEQILERLEFDSSELTDNPTKVHGFVQGHLDDMILEACHHGRAWTNADMPPIVAKQIRSALARFLRRPEGYIVSRAGDENLAWADEYGHGGSPAFTLEEIDAIQEAAAPGRAGFGTIQTRPFGPQHDPEDSILYAPIGGLNHQFPLAQLRDDGRVRFP